MKKLVKPMKNKLKFYAYYCFECPSGHVLVNGQCKACYSGWVGTSQEK